MVTLALISTANIHSKNKLNIHISIHINVHIACMQISTVSGQLAFVSLLDLFNADLSPKRYLRGQKSQVCRWVGSGVVGCVGGNSAQRHIVTTRMITAPL